MRQQGEVLVAAKPAQIHLVTSHIGQHLNFDFKGVEGLPSYFSNFRRILGSRSINVKKGSINTGELVDWQSSAPND